MLATGRVCHAVVNAAAARATKVTWSVGVVAQQRTTHMKRPALVAIGVTHVSLVSKSKCSAPPQIHAEPVSHKDASALCGRPRQYFFQSAPAMATRDTASQRMSRAGASRSDSAGIIHSRGQRCSHPRVNLGIAARPGEAKHGLTNCVATAAAAALDRPSSRPTSSAEGLAGVARAPTLRTARRTGPVTEAQLGRCPCRRGSDIAVKFPRGAQLPMRLYAAQHLADGSTMQ